MKKRLLIMLVVASFAGLGVVVGFLWATAPRHRITEESYEALKEGMTEDEVERIFAVPAGDYEPPARREGERIYPSSDLFIPSVPAEKKVWSGGGLVIGVWFDAAGKLFYKRKTWKYSEGSLDKIRRYLFTSSAARK